MNFHFIITQKSAVIFSLTSSNFRFPEESQQTENA